MPLTYITIGIVTLFVSSYMFFGAHLFGETIVFNMVFYGTICLIAFIASAVCLLDYTIRPTSHSAVFNMFLFVALMIASTLQIFEITYSVASGILGHGIVVDALVLTLCLSEGVRVLDYTQMLFAKRAIERRNSDIRA